MAARSPAGMRSQSGALDTARASAWSTCSETGHDDGADLTPAIAGVEHRLAFARLLDPANDRGGMPRLAKRLDELVAQRG